MRLPFWPCSLDWAQEVWCCDVKVDLCTAAEIFRIKGVFTESDDSFSLASPSNLPSNIEFLTWLSSGACEVDSSIFTEISGSLVSSASSMNLISLNSRNAAWRKSIIKRLRERDEKETSRDNKYEEGISQVSES